MVVEYRVVVEADLNGHIGTSNEGVKRIHRGFGFGQNNADGGRVLDLEGFFLSGN